MGYRILARYPRRAHLEFYRRNPNPFYGVSFELDATRVRERARALDASTYAALIWAYHRALIGIDAFRTRLMADDVVLYDTLHVGMTLPAPDRTFTFATLDWDPEPARFLTHAAERMELAKTHVDLSGEDTPNFAYYTALPKVPFTSFTHVALPDPLQGQPETAFGRFREQDGRTIVPVGLLVNHVYVDGADLGDLYESLTESFVDAF
ncbi:MAG TPA: CatA-like O-acetyltransferase [Candidatus Limnocylindrales bacterium]|nr:CatA-like O-acetyltransferase [Candidatus Limnocylindrales bacterium]